MCITINVQIYVRIKVYVIWDSGCYILMKDIK